MSDAGLTDIGRMPRSRPMLAALKPLLLLGGGTFGAAILSMAAQLLLARHLTVGDFGRLATILAAVNILSPIATFGVNWFWVQVFGREGYAGFRWVGPSMLLLACTNGLSLLLFAGYVFGSAAAFAGSRADLVAFGSLILLGQSAVDIASARFQLEERFGALALWQSSMQLGRLVVAMALVASIGSLEAVLGGYALVGFLLLLGGSAACRAFLTGRLQLAGHGQAALGGTDTVRPSLFTVAKLSFPFAFITMFYLVYFQSVILLISLFLGSEVTALFSSVLLILSAIYLIPNVIFTKFLIARLCRWAEHDPQMFRATLHLSVAAMVVTGVAGMLVTAVMAPLVIPLMFSTKYANAIPLLVWLAPTIPLRFVQSAYSAMLVSAENVRRRVSYAGISAGCSLVVNLALLPTLGLPGAVLASILAEGVLLLLNARGVALHVPGVRLRDSVRPGVLLEGFHLIMQGGALPRTPPDRSNPLDT